MELELSVDQLANFIGQLQIALLIEQNKVNILNNELNDLNLKHNHALAKLEEIENA